MLYQNLLIIALHGFLSGTNAAPGLEKRAVSTDGTCSSSVTCVGSKYGDCCSQYGFCGSGQAYCGASSVTSGSPSNTATKSTNTGSASKVSTDGTCGNGVTCQGSTFGNCCSQYGYCGSSTDHCDTGCQSAFGTCTSTAASSKASTTQTAKTTTTKTAVSSNVASTITATATTTTAAATTTCTVVPSQLVENPGFEDGSSPWTFTGGAKLSSNSDFSPWYFTTTDGTYYGLLVSSLASPSSSITQTLSAINSYTATLSFDWKMMMSVTSRGPPQTQCTLNVTLDNYITPTSWMYPGTQGGGGHVETTFGLGIFGGDLTFSLACTNLASVFQVGVLIDNVNFKTVC